jgi:hypothetical protein
MGVFPVNNMQDVTSLEGNAQLVARDVQVIIRVVREVSSVVVLIILSLFLSILLLKVLKIYNYHDFRDLFLWRLFGLRSCRIWLCG